MRLDTPRADRSNTQGFLTQIAEEVDNETYRPVPKRSCYIERKLECSDSGTRIFRPDSGSKTVDSARQTTLSGDYSSFGFFGSPTNGSSKKPSRSSNGYKRSRNGKGNYFTRILDELDCVEKTSTVYDVKDKGKSTELKSRVKWLETAFKDDNPASGGNGSLGGDCVDLIMSLVYRIKALRRYDLPSHANSELELMTEDINQLLKLLK
jgi:hypothetical protein